MAMKTIAAIGTMPAGASAIIAGLIPSELVTLRVSKERVSRYESRPRKVLSKFTTNESIFAVRLKLVIGIGN